MEKYYPPEGFAKDENSGLYYRWMTQPRADGTPGQVVVWFNAETGEYTQTDYSQEPAAATETTTPAAEAVATPITESPISDAAPAAAAPAAEPEAKPSKRNAKNRNEKGRVKADPLGIHDSDAWPPRKMPLEFRQAQIPVHRKGTAGLGVLLFFVAIGLSVFLLICTQKVPLLDEAMGYVQENTIPNSLSDSNLDTLLNDALDSLDDSTIDAIEDVLNGEQAEEPVVEEPFVEEPVVETTSERLTDLDGIFSASDLTTLQNQAYALADEYGITADEAYIMLTDELAGDYDMDDFNTLMDYVTDESVFHAFLGYWWLDDGGDTVSFVGDISQLMAYTAADAAPVDGQMFEFTIAEASCIRGILWYVPEDGSTSLPYSYTFLIDFYGNYKMTFADLLAECEYLDLDFSNLSASDIEALWGLL